MSGVKYFFVGLLSFFIVLLILFYIYVYKLQKPTPGVDCHKNSDWLWNSNCTAFQEITPDSTLQSPSTEQLYLYGFSQVSGAGPSICLPVWYRFRYVNVNTGGYSPFSEWTSLPIMSGASQLPCNGQCSGSIPIGSASCNCNQITVGTNSLIYSPTQPLTNGDFVYANVHRYVGQQGSVNQPPADAQDEIIGFLFPQGNNYVFIDALNNPCLSNTCPSSCTGC